MRLRQTHVCLPSETGRHVRSLVSAGALGALVACASAPDASFEPVAAQHSAIRVEHPAFDPAQAVHSVSRDPTTGSTWYVDEVNGRQAFGVIVTSRLPAGREAIRRTTEEWVRSILGPSYRIAWSTTGKAPNAFGPVSYRLFRMGGTQGASFACVGFSQRRAFPEGEGAPRDILFGYFCTYGDRALEARLAEQMLTSIEPRQENGNGASAEM